MRSRCPLCSNQLVEAIGPENSPVLLAGEFPGYYEIQSGLPFVGPSGDVLKSELSRLSVDWRKLRLTNLWAHDKVKDEEELDYHFGNLLREMEGRKAVLLMGSDTVRQVSGDAVLEVSGLQLSAPIVPKSVEVLMATVNPAFVLHDTVGEFRLALDRFFKKARKYL